MKGGRGAVGIKGERGIVGNQGRKGDKGEKGESAKASQASVVPQTNWKQCVWKSQSSTNNGKIKVNKNMNHNTTPKKIHSFLNENISKKNVSPLTHRLPTHYINDYLVTFPYNLVHFEWKKTKTKTKHTHTSHYRE